ncbi:MAG: thioredoxin domain-containing protein, partial [Alphaproteobacteria bacterium]
MSRNLLGTQTSPYLLQHKDNPVHWHPWGEAALEEARASGKPILLSIGYAACHWCHVMAHESFEDEEVAAVMNELFVNIKVDREERPDVDMIYMNALHALGEQGGWPLTMFLTPEGKPFWGGTYFPKTPRYGRPGFISVLKEVARVFHEEPEKIENNAAALFSHVSPRPGRRAQGDITEAHIADAARSLTQLCDPHKGGLRGAPKFPQTPLFAFLWRAALRYGDASAREAVIRTLTHICQGGIMDHLGGGFARYTVDAGWLVPHFEKMLYDNAQLVELLTSVWQETGEALFGERVRESVAWLLREMRLPEGGFASSLDADSEGEEGRFYVWSLDEIIAVLGDEDAASFAAAYDARKQGNWEGKIILNRLGSQRLGSNEEEARLKEMRAKLLEARSRRVRPGFDDKVLADWNGLTISALAKAGQAFGEADWIAAAESAFNFVRTRMNRADRLLHSWRAG